MEKVHAIMRMNFRNMIVALMLSGMPIVMGISSEPAPPPPPRFGEITATLAELQTLADAMTVVYLDTGYYVSIENLNDLLSNNTVYDFDNINNGGGTWVIDPATALFKPQMANLTVPPHLWQGPYVTYQDSRISLTGSGYDRGTLLDFWGTPYYLFSPAGLVRTDQHVITLELYDDYFDSYAIVSLGPDGVMSSDDLIYTFGEPPTRLVLTSLSVQSAYRGDTVRLRGYNFGAGGSGNSRLLLGAMTINAISSWSDRQIEFTVPSGAASGNVSVEKGQEVSNGLPLTILEHPSAAAHWLLYE
ncbi:MAG: IPT/TIG domain-containing protein [Candidatus Sumerlaeota bacterium]|nr:IPT/TIG domain-containing protein [Candidatus Sumerlaeota bacterium]